MIFKGVLWYLMLSSAGVTVSSDFRSGKREDVSTKSSVIG